jgi:Ulp1 family protease
MLLLTKKENQIKGVNLCEGFHQSCDFTAVHYLVIPIHRPGHWTVALVDISNWQIIAYDSMQEKQCKKLSNY